MAYGSVTYTFTNSTTADATQVNQNFTDIINATSDGTKDFNISALTAAGAAVLNGACTFGASTSNLISFLGALATSIPISANTTYDIGTSTKGLRALYLGGTSTYTAKVQAPTLSGSYTLTLPPDGGTAGYVAQTDGNGVITWSQNWGSTNTNRFVNLAIASSISTNALVVAIKGQNGSDPSATNPVYVAFRSATATTGAPVVRTLTGALSLTIASSATMGLAANTNGNIYVYLLDNAGTVGLGVSAVLFDEGTKQSATQTASNSNAVLYTNLASASYPIRLIGRIVAQSAQPNWTTTETSVFPFQLKRVYLRVASNGSTDTVTGGGPSSLTFRTIVKDTHNAWSSNTTFTAPAAGKYVITCQSYVNAAAAYSEIDIILNSSSISFSKMPIASGTNSTIKTTDYLDLAVGDTISFQISNASSAQYNVGTTGSFAEIQQIE